MSAKKYDLIFSLGAACLCSSTLRKKNLQFYSYPLDWVFGGDFTFRVDLLVSDFENYINKEDLVFTGKQNEAKHNLCDVYMNKRNNIGFNHDFPVGIPFEEAFPIVKAKYERRISRLIENINRAKDILIVYTVPPYQPEETSDSALLNGYERIVQRFPNKNIDILYISCADEFSETPVSEHIKKSAFDYRRPERNPPHDARLLRKIAIAHKYKLRQTLSDRIRNFIFKMKKRIKRWKRKF